MSDYCPLFYKRNYKIFSQDLRSVKWKFRLNCLLWGVKMKVESGDFVMPGDFLSVSEAYWELEILYTVK